MTHATKATKPLVKVNEIPVVKAQVQWVCPECLITTISTTYYGCFTRFTRCLNCGLKVIPDTSEDGE